MKKKFRGLIIRLRKYLPLDRELRNEYKRIILTIQITVMAIVACILFGVIDLVRNFYSSVIQDISAVMAFCFSLFLISRGKFNAGKIIVILYSSLTILINSSKEGRFAGNEFLWFPILGGIFLFFSVKEKKLITLSFAVVIGCVFFLEYTNYSYFMDPSVVIEYSYLNYILCFTVTVSMVCLFMVYLIRANADSEKKLERLNHTLMLRNENLKKINSELDSFVYKASHDMRSPLTSLLGLIEISKREKDPNALNNFLELQAKSIRKLDSYIVDILNISRNARMKMQDSEIDFKEMTEEIFAQLHYFENCSLVNKEVNIIGDAVFMSDPVRLNIVLNNLISNSIRYADLSKPQPRLTVTVHVTQDFATIEVYDNGTGISEGHLGNVFEMFYRATETNNGSGLGLYIVKETLNKIKGTISIKSEYGKYTAIKIIVPNNAKSTEGNS